MKTKYWKRIVGILCMVAVIAASAVLAGCGGDDAVISYTGTTLADATVGADYNGTVATATGADGIAYALKSGTLPAGLTFASDGSGKITGKPTAVTLNASFVVTASKEGLDSVDAAFLLSVLSAPEEGAKTFKVEAENADLMNKLGAGPSNTAFETAMISDAATASAGRYLFDTWMADLFFDYVITADAAAKGTLKIAFGSELGVVTMGPDDVEISFNGTPFDYVPVQLPGSLRGEPAFTVYTFGEINLVAGSGNTVRITIKENLLRAGNQTGGPLIDYISIDTAAELTWTKYNA